MNVNIGQLRCEMVVVCGQLALKNSFLFIYIYITEDMFILMLTLWAEIQKNSVGVMYSHLSFKSRT